MSPRHNPISCVVIGGSAGGIDAFTGILSKLPKDFTIPIVCVFHLPPLADFHFVQALNKTSPLPVLEAKEKELIKNGFVYIAPGGYHLLIEKDKTFSLNLEDRVAFSRPSIDVLFESVSRAYPKSLVAIVLSGANRDGAEGVKFVKESGGICIAQDPNSAQVDAMPKYAIETNCVDYILDLDGIAQILISFDHQTKESLS